MKKYIGIVYRMVSIFMIEFYRFLRVFISIIRVKLWNLYKYYGIFDIYIYMLILVEKYLMDVLIVLLKVERYLIGLRFRLEWGRDVLCLVFIYYCG